jgi:peptide/nickel transport system permease protein
MRALMGRGAYSGAVQLPLPAVRLVLAFLVRRLLSVVAVMVAVAALVFSVFYAFRPERIADGTGYPHQLVHFLDRAFLHADLGRSSERQLSFRPVMEMLKAGIPADISLVVGGLVVGAATGVALGAVAAQRRGSLIDRGLTGFAAFAMSAPVYWVGAMAVVFFHPEVGKFARLPISEPNTYEPLTRDPLAWLQSLWLPWIILGLPLAAITMRLMRASLAETLEEDFVRTARGKGLSPGRVMRRHAVPAASAPVIPLVGVTMGTLVTNAILLETTFSIPGIFSLMTNALANVDLAVIEGVAIAGAFLVVVANLLADIVHAWLDPRVRIS